MSRRRKKETLQWEPRHAHDWLDRGYNFPNPKPWHWKIKETPHTRANPTHPQLAVDLTNKGIDIGTRPTLFWATKDMDQLVANAWEAATDADMDAILGAFEAPCPHGMILYEDLGALRERGGHDLDARVCGLEWAVIGGRTWFRPVMAFTDGLPGAGVGPNFVLPVDSLRAGGADAELLDDAAHTLGWLVEYAAITLNLMMTPTVVERSPLAAGGRSGYVAAKAGRPIPEVNLLRLRPMKYEKADTDSRGNPYKHRFVVSGHWRNQPHGKGRKKRRRIWVNPYIKGPENAPLLNQKKVYVWAR